MEIHLTIRNLSYQPHLEGEGSLICPLPSPPPVKENELWHTHLSPHDRLYYHQTLNSVRRCKRFLPTSQIPRDSLEFKLQSRYNHSLEAFPDKVDFIMQKETCARERGATFRVLRNMEDIILPGNQELRLPLIIGGVREKISPDSVKLINSGPHDQRVNNGYSRQSSDGNFFRY